MNPTSPALSATAPATPTTPSEPSDAGGGRPERPGLDADARGLYAIAATPFSTDGAVDPDSIRSLMDFYLGCGVSGVTLLGMLGEADKLSDDESLQVVRTGLKAIAGRVPVVVGARAGGIDPLVHFARRVVDAGAGGVMVAPASGLRTDEAIYGYFEQIAERLGDIRWVLQDHPQATGVHLAGYLIIRMIQDFPNLAMVKHEDWPGLGKLTLLRDAQRQGGRRVSILIGNGAIHYPLELGRGADGAMTGFAYPEALVKTRELYEAGKRDDAEDVYDAYLPLIRHELQPGLGLAVRKYLLARRRAIRCEKLRAPGPGLSVLDRQEVDHLVRRMERRTRQLGIGQPIASPG